MFGKEIVLSKNNTSIISKGLLLKGNLVSDGLLEVEGQIDGNVKGNEITIRETGSITGKLVANVVNIKGNFEGVIRSQKINISGKAVIKGTLEYVALCVEDGASIIGDLKRLDEIILDDDETILSASKNSYNKKSNSPYEDMEDDKKDSEKNKNIKLNKKFKKNAKEQNTEQSNYDNQSDLIGTENQEEDKKETEGQYNI